METPDFTQMGRELFDVTERALADVPTIHCERCDGKGYHHGFGEDGHDPDHCDVCGGSGEMVDEPEYTRRQNAAVANFLRKVHTDAIESAAKHLESHGCYQTAATIRALATKEDGNGR